MKREEIFTDLNTSNLSNFSKVAKTIPEIKTERWIDADEGACLYSLLKMINVDHCFESGTANGYSALWITLGLENNQILHTFDPIDRIKLWEHKRSSIPSQQKEKIIFHNEEFSSGVGRILKNCKGKKLFFIDGDHNRKEVKKDINSIFPYLEKGDLLVLHDIKYESVFGIWEKTLRKLNNPNTLMFKTKRGIGVIFVDKERENIHQERNFNLINGETEKVRDIRDWATHKKPYNNYPGKALLSSSEKHLLYLTAKRLGSGNYANLGTWKGVSAACLAYGIKDANEKGTIYAVDIFSLPVVRNMPEIIPRNFKELGLDSNVEIKICKGLTSYWAQQLRNINFKFIFVDADHTYEGVKEDFELWSPLLIKGGEIAFHDCEYEEIDRLLKEKLVPPKWELVDEIWRTKLYKRLI